MLLERNLVERMRGNCCNCVCLIWLKELWNCVESTFALTLSELGFKSSLADPDVWMKPAVKADGTK